MPGRLCFFANPESIHTQRWVQFFADRGWEVFVVTGYPPQQSFAIRPGVKLYPIYSPPRLLKRFIALARMFPLLRRLRPDIIHVHYLSHFGLLAAIYSTISGFGGIVLTPWGSDVLLVGRLRRLLVKYLMKKAALITCDAEHIKKASFVLRGNPNGITLIFFGTDVEKFNPGRANVDLRSQLGTLGWPCVISSRNLEPLYDVQSLIAAAPLVLEEHPETRFAIAGTGSQEAELKELSIGLGVSNSVLFLGRVPNDQLAGYFASADVYVSTSLSDAGLAASTAEAMACGLPVVITDFGDNGKWVQDGRNGFIIPLKDSGSLAQRILELVGDPPLRKRFGKVNRKIIEHRNNYYREMDRMGRLYEQMISGCV